MEGGRVGEGGKKGRVERNKGHTFFSFSTLDVGELMRESGRGEAKGEASG